MTLYVQFQTMGLMLASGLAIGLLFDLYRVLANELRFPRWLMPLLDLAYWTFATYFVFRVLFYSNYGQVRLFVFIGLFAGVAFYFAALSRTARRVIRWLIGVVKKLIWLCKRIIEIFVIGPILALYKFLTILLGFVAAIAIFLYKIVLQLLYPVRVLSRAVLHLAGRHLPRPGWLVSGWRRLLRFFRR